MTMSHRVLLAVGILSLDLVVFFLPLTGFFLAYVLVANPPWVKDFICGMDSQKP